jgi:UDP-N-acetyl-D-galactosamine dehydrogenase
MNNIRQNNLKITVVGLGYVGLPLAIALARKFPVTGFDADQARITELSLGDDRTGEMSPAELARSSITFVDDLNGAVPSDVFVIAVPTPIDHENNPDLSALESASHAVGRHLKPGNVVVYESTVYPGVTEEICGPILETESGLACGEEFFLGYSPERINPGDQEHAIDKVTKVIAGQTPDVTELLASFYGEVIPAGVYRAPDIRTAEAAKVIENAQRDINIAFINEVAMIFHRLGIETEDVLAAARTKWNFLDFRPGLVGGHCIGVDPYYLAHAAEKANFNPEIILAGRRINDGMAAYVADELDRLLQPSGQVLVLGLTFKENVSDLRNSQVVDMVRALAARGHHVEIFDPIASPDDVQAFYGLTLKATMDRTEPYDAIIGAVAHDPFRAMASPTFDSLVKPGGLLVDLKGIWPDLLPTDGRRVWRL